MLTSYAHEFLSGVLLSSFAQQFCSAVLLSRGRKLALSQAPVVLAAAGVFLIQLAGRAANPTLSKTPEQNPCGSRDDAFDLADEKKARVCACIRVFHRGKTYDAVKFKATYRAVDDKSHRAIFEIVRMPRRPAGERWGVVGWDIDGPEYSFMAVPTKAVALAMPREFLPR